MKAKKSLGQNFLVDSSVARRIIDAVSPASDEAVIEIGPGRGALTKLLLLRAGFVTAIEIDRELIDYLHNEIVSDRLNIVEADVLKVDLQALTQEILREHPALHPRIRVVANLPYYISTAVITHFVNSRAVIKDLTVMLQREVAERIVSSPGCKEYGALSVLVQLHCRTKILFHVSPGAFRPVPKVDSSILMLEIKDLDISPVKDQKLFEKVVRAAFAQRRKTIFNSLKANRRNIDERLTDQQISLLLSDASIAPQRRAETLSFEEYIRLSNAFFLFLRNDLTPPID